MVMRAALGFVSMSVLMISFVLLVELVSGRWRTIIGILGMLPIAIAYVLMAGIAYVSPDWRTTQLIITLPWVAMLLMWYVHVRGGAFVCGEFRSVGRVWRFPGPFVVTIIGSIITITREECDDAQCASDKVHLV